MSTAYCSLSRAPPPLSVMNQPVMVRLFVVEPAVFDSVSKLCVDADPSVVRLTHWARATEGRQDNRLMSAKARSRRRRALDGMDDSPKS